MSDVMKAPKSPRRSAGDEIDRIASTLEEDIIFGRIGPGARLVEDELIERFGIKRYAVREVLRKLESFGVVSRSPNKGASVRNYERKELEDIYAVRDILAREAVRLMRVPVEQASIDALQRIQDDYIAASERAELGKINRHNNEFHSALFALCGNAQLSGLIDHYAWLTQAFRAIGIVSSEMRARARAEHQEMIDCLRAGDRERLATLCVDHMRPAREMYFAARGWL